MPRYALLIIVALMLVPGRAPSVQGTAPPNEPAQVELSGDSIRLRYNGSLIFDGRITNPAALRDARPLVVRTADAIEQVIALHASGRAPLEIGGNVTASDEAFPCESDRGVRALPLVRHSSGLSGSLLNQAVYDRRWDWVLSVDDQPRTVVRVVPMTESHGARSFELQAHGSEIVLRFRPRFYQKHRGLRLFEPWTYRVWPRPVVGWCSWFAFFDKVTEQDVMRTSDVMSEVLVPYAGLAQYNSFNNVVWQNDPDHIELSDTEAWRSTMVTSLTGSMFMLTDKPERYRTPLVEPARRAAPVLVTTPGQIYDVDPSRSSQLWRVDGEVSGRDPKAFDAGLTPAVNLYLLDVNRPFESWVVLGRTGGHFDEIRFEDLGLDGNKEYLVFEFFNSQVFVIRERVPHPQLIATSRHITGGGVDLLDVQWNDGVLGGRSRVVRDDTYEIYLTEPSGWDLAEMQCDGAKPLRIERQGAVVRTGCQPDTNRDIAWRALFRKSR